MSLIIVTPLNPATINQSETDDVQFLAAGTLNIAGTAASPINVTLSQVAGVAAGTTINISNANVQLNGAAGVSAITTYNVGANSTLQLNSTLNVAVGSVVNLSGSNSNLVIGSGVDLSPFSSIGGFRPGSTIDLTGLSSTRYTYTDNTGTDTGGTLTLYDANNVARSTLTLSSGEYTAGSFTVRSDSTVGTLISFTPTVTGVTTDPSSGTLGSGQVAHITVATNEPVTVTGTAPTLTLSDGGTATYDPATSTPTSLVFDHTVQPGQNTPDLTITAANTAGSTITDAAANLLDLAGAIGNPAGILAVDTTAQGSATVPTVTGVTTVPGSGNLGTGDSVRVVVTTSEPVSVTNGTPTLTLSDGGVATYDPANSTPTSLAFDNTVQAGQTSPDLTVIGSSLNGATIADASGGLLSLAGAAVNPPGILTVGSGSSTGTGTGTGTTGGGTTTGGTTTGGTTTGGGTTGGGTTGGGTTGGGTTGGTGSTGTGTTTGDQNTGGNNQGSTGTTTGTTTYGTIPIYRFFESTNGTHFFTPSAGERSTILSTRPDLIPEGQNGVGLYAADPSSGDPNAAQVFRFFDTIHGTQFLTASTAERDTVLATRHDLTYEPNGSFYEHTQPQAGDTAVYRFFSSTDGTHFYTDSATERATILQTRPDLVAEGIGFYEPKHA